MTTQTQTLTKTETTSIHPATHPGYVHLRAANLERQIEFYEKVIGLRMHWRKDGNAEMGVGNEDLLRLTEKKDAIRYR